LKLQEVTTPTPSFLVVHGPTDSNHPDMTTLTREEMLAEVRKAEEAICRMTGRTCRPLFRQPYGAWNAEVLAALGEADYPCSVYWCLDTLDWKHPPASEIVARVMDQVTGGAIILMHLGGASTPAASAILIPQLLARQFQFVTVSQLVSKGV
jgi:peptidoglycan/xylan/chitin deacetylase (PgdA/CDA1 family)